MSRKQRNRPIVSIKPMRLADGRTDYWVSIKVGEKDVTPHVFRGEYKAAYHVALYDWLLNGIGEEPDCVEFGPNDWPARLATPLIDAQWVWLIWGLTPGTCDLVAIATTEEIRDRYVVGAGPRFTTVTTEKVLLDHAYGYRMVLSAMNRSRPKP
ncbi:hypothetical protein JJC00_18935 [Bradyrhizobium diazoefficiens]|uniref:hypothetical protein n=1 Tax=Bradyrhizobium diazoefficiens TaxID=1355477 RepID=UPI00190A5631|nr:hypothetical protein [Bradyrhizobium diazoefficiens]QQO30761.1 hypothetical protein JJC00_18935 [Bradyrhizobium diazoefficiens]